MKYLSVLVLSSCALACGTNPSTPDLARLYKNQTDPSVVVPVILLHGVMGGRLVNQTNGNETWPGSLRRLLFDDYRALRLDISVPNALPIKSDLAVQGITDRAAGKDFYGRVIDVLQSAGQYTLSNIGEPAQGDRRRLYVYTYDWRQDNVHSARGLHEFIEQLRIDHNDPDLKVDIVAHSMGGLITRYYARYGTEDVLNDNALEVNSTGAQRIRRVVLLGTPNFGSVVAADVLNNGMKIGFGRIPPEVVATFPSTYQVLPHALNNWLLDTSGTTLKRDIFDINFWRDGKLSIFHPKVKQRIIEQAETEEEGAGYFVRYTEFFYRSLERARRFTWSLTVPVDESRIRYVVFGGDCTLTPSHLIFESNENGSYLRLQPNEVRDKIAGVDYSALMLDPGDGTVSKASLLARQSSDPTVARHQYSYFPLGYAFFLCENHQSLTGNVSFQDNLLNALLSADPL